MNTELKKQVKGRMQVYYFTNLEHGIENIKKRRLKVARISQLNDPFEFIAMKLGSRVQRKKLRYLKDEINKEFGVICFSGDWTQPLMWSHYADRHRGICLGFNIADTTELKAIRYIRDLPEPETTQGLSFEAMTEEQRLELGFVKSADWEYEEEHRLIVKLAHTEAELDRSKNPPETLNFQPFSDQIKLNKIFVGARCSLDREELEDLIAAHYEDVELIRARLAFNSFKVVKQHDPSMWNPSY